MKYTGVCSCLILMAVGGILTFSWAQDVGSSQPTSVPANNPPIILTISLGKEAVKQGDGPELTAVIENNSAEPLQIDQSVFLRNYRVVLTDERGQEIAPRPAATKPAVEAGPGRVLLRVVEPKGGRMKESFGLSSAFDMKKGVPYRVRLERSILDAKGKKYDVKSNTVTFTVN